MARLTVERKDFGKNTLIINHLSINLNMLNFIFFKKTTYQKPKYYSVVIHFKEFWFYCIVKKILKTNLKRTKSMSCRIIKIRRGVALSESVFQRFMGAFMVRYTCLIKKIIMCFKILFVCKFTVKRVKRITTKLWSLSSKI